MASMRTLCFPHSEAQKRGTAELPLERWGLNPGTEVHMSADQLNGNREYLMVSDFDQTLSFNDSGVVLSEMLGIPDFGKRIAGLSDIRLVQQGGELAYLLLHDPAFRCVRKEHLLEVGRRVRLKANSVAGTNA